MWLNFVSLICRTLIQKLQLSSVQKAKQCWQRLERLHSTLPLTMATAGAVPINALDMTFFAERQWIMTFISSPFFLSFIGLAASYHVMAPMCATSKQASWVLTAISSAVMSIASLPFLWVYFTDGGNVKSIRVLPHFAVIVVRFFQAYLTA
jgi:hypothetical protein